MKEAPGLKQSIGNWLVSAFSLNLLILNKQTENALNSNGVPTEMYLHAKKESRIKSVFAISAFAIWLRLIIGPEVLTSRLLFWRQRLQADGSHTAIATF